MRGTAREPRRSGFQLCSSYRDLLVDIRENGVRKPLRVLEPALFGRTRELSFHDGGNRLFIAVVLELREIPCLIHPADVRQAERKNLLAPGQPYGSP